MKSNKPIQISPWAKELNDVKTRSLFRVMPSIAGPPGRKIFVDGREAINFSSNNYLGLAAHPEVIQGMVRYTQLYGAGSTASRLIAGNTEAHRELESAIAKWKGTEAAVLFGSGYQANVGILSSLVESSDLVISDELNHASIIDGCRLSRARVEIYPHLDMNSLEDLLRLGGFRRKLVVTESVFSMDGDHAPLNEITGLCVRWGALLMVDEAHASGLFGPQGQGLAAEHDVVPEIQMGTLSKAIGASGAYVAGYQGTDRPFDKQGPISRVFDRAAPGSYGSRACSAENHHFGRRLGATRILEKKCQKLSRSVKLKTQLLILKEAILFRS